MGKEIDDIEFDELLQEKRHRELTQAMKGVATAISSNKDAEILKALEGQPKAIMDAVVGALKELPKPENPEINVEVNNSEIVTLMGKVLADTVEDLKKSNEKLIQAINDKKQPQKLKAVRNSFSGEIDYVIIEYSK